ncbi:MAG: hypothetical protein HDQ88_05410, partial [Clostridia bacterium]|nr:hypothetical protein [Clostridia bacterium]
TSLMLNVEINALCAKLPKTGRLQYNAQSMQSLRPEIDRLANLLIRSDSHAFFAYGQMQKEFTRIENDVKKLASEGKLGYVDGKRMSSADIAAAMGDGAMRNKSMSMNFVDMKNVDYFDRLKGDFKARVGNVVLAMCKDVIRSNYVENRRVARVNAKHLKIEAKHRRGYRKDLLLSAQCAMAAMCDQERANFLKTVQQHERDIEHENMQNSSAV